MSKSAPRYLIWMSGDKLKYKVGKETHEIPWSLQREREVIMLGAKWDEAGGGLPETEFYATPLAEERVKPDARS